MFFRHFFLNLLIELTLLFIGHTLGLFFKFFLGIFRGLLHFFLCIGYILIIGRNDLAHIDDADIAGRRRTDGIAHLHDGNAGNTQYKNRCNDSGKNLDILFLTHF